jgi:predicted transcriptional regulator
VKATICVSDDVFEAIERLARRTKKSRTQLFSAAVREYGARHAAGEITGASDRVYAELETGPDKFAAEAATRTLERLVW